MMSVRRLSRSATRAANYYFKTHGEAGPVESHWLGRGAESFGLTGPVSEEYFTDLARGFLDKQKLLRNAGHNFPGHDLTLSAGKAYSVLSALASPERRAELEACGLEALKKAVREVETHARTRRGAGGRSEPEPVAGLFVAVFGHKLARPTKDALPMPHSHWHCVVFNVAHCADGQTRAQLGISRKAGQAWSETRSPFFEKKKELGLSFRRALAEELESRLGLSVTVTANDLKIEGVPEELCRHFSHRRRDVEAELARSEKTGGRAAAFAALRTREPKGQVDRAALEAYWREEAARTGITLSPQLLCTRRELAAERTPSVERRTAPEPRAAEPKKEAPRKVPEAQRTRERSEPETGWKLFTPLLGVAPVGFGLRLLVRRDLRRVGLQLSKEERAAARRLTGGVRRNRQLLLSQQASKARVLSAAAEYWRRAGARVYIVSASWNTIRAMRGYGTPAYAPRSFAKGLTTKRTWLETFRILRGERVGPGAETGEKYRTPVQFRKLSAFLKFAETTKNSTWFRFDRQTVLILDETQHMSEAQLSVITRAAHRKGATIVDARYEGQALEQSERAAVVKSKTRDYERER